MKFRHIGTSILISIMVSWVSYAQKPHLFNSESGLPNSKISAIIEDSKGFLWIGTEDGIARFDGEEFTPFHNTKNGIQEDDSTVSILEDSRGTFWVGTSMGLQIFDQKNNVFNKYNFHDDSEPESNMYVYRILELPEENGRSSILALTSQHGIYVIDSETHELDNSQRDKLNKVSGSLFTNRILLDSKNRLWMASEFGGLKAIEKNSFALVEGLWSELGSNMAEKVLVTSMAEDEKTGNIIIGSSNYGILIFDAREGHIRQAADASARNCHAVVLMKDSIYHRAGDRLFLVGTENSGIMIFDLETESVRSARFFNIPYNTEKWKIHSLLEDSQGNIWASVYQTGLLIIPRSMFGFYTSSFTESMAPGDNGACVTSIIESPVDKSMWVGTDGEGLFHTDTKRNTTCFNSRNSKLPNNSIMDLAFDQRGTLWIATYLDGIVTYTASEGFKPLEDNVSIGTSKVFCLTYDEKRDLMYAGTYGNGLSVIQASTGKVLKTISEDLNQWINTLFIDNNGMLWMGTNNGPMCYNPESQRLYTYDVKEDFKITKVNVISQTSDGTMWLGTAKGLFSFSRTGENTKLYTEKDGLSNNNIHGIIEDGEGNLWVSTSNGLTKINHANGIFSRFFTNDGLQSNEFRTNSSFKSQTGQLYFGGNNGYTTFFPQTIGQKVHKTPQIYFTKLLVGGVDEVYDKNKKKNILDKYITDATSITLPYKRNAFSIQYSAPEFANPQRIHYIYKLDKFDKDWKNASINKTAVYTNLPHGRYTLTVKAFFDGDEDEYTTKSIKLRIHPPFSLSLWAFIFYILLGAVLILFLYDYRNKSIKANKEMEESAIKEMKLQMFTNLSHEIRTPLTLVMSPLKKMRENETDPGKKDLYNLMYRNSLRILRLVSQVMDIQKVDNGQMKMHFHETDIVYFIKDIMKSFDNMAKTRKVDFSINSADSSKKIWIDQNNFDKVIFNIISNAFKYTPEGGKIAIELSGEKNNDGVLTSEIGKFVEIKISNTGSHLDDKDIEKVFDRYYQSDIKDSKAGSGVGLNLAKMLTELHHGTIHAENTDEGVSFIIYMPAGKAHLRQEELSEVESSSDLYTKEINKENIISNIEDIPDASIQDDDVKKFKSKKNVVFVDDNIEMLNYVKAELKDAFNIEIYSNTKEAWASVTANQPDAIVTDLIMETETEGAEFCEKVKHNPGTNLIPVIILSSKTDEDSIQKCTECGADKYLTKPISTKLLKSSIIQAILTRETIKNKYTSEVGYDYNEVKMTSSDDKLLNKVIESIKANIDNTNYGVEDLSRDVGMSRVHMNRKLKECISLSPSNLIKAIRLKQAAYLLANNKVNISEVAYRVGFSTHSYFSSTFHDYFGLTPKEFVAKYSDSKDDESLKKLLEL